MKCGIITFHRAQNFGAILQTYALQTSVEKFGGECEVIDYRCPFLEKHYQPLSIRTLPSVKRIAAIILRNGRVKDNRENFIDFTDQYLKLSATAYYNRDQLDKCNDYYDMFITGSDQVWSYLTAGFDKNYFLEFVHDKNKKNSYAASFGVDSIPQNYKEEYYNLLNDFKNTSVREEQGAKIINDILSITPPVVLDPTLLLNSNDWSKVTSSNSENENYLLLYLIVESKNILSLAKKIAKKRNLKIIYINDCLYKRGGMDNRSKIRVEEWVSLFLNASCIVTNSFHGIAFSINFQKEFFMQYLPGNAKVNSRLENILRIFKLTDRCIIDINSFESIKEIDYNEVNEILSFERSKSIDYLDKIISNVKNNK